MTAARKADPIGSTCARRALPELAARVVEMARKPTCRPLADLSFDGGAFAFQTGDYVFVRLAGGDWKIKYLHR